MASNKIDCETNDLAMSQGDENLEVQAIDSMSQIEAEFQRTLMDCEKEDVYAVIVGLTGSGKSSLVNRLCRLEGSDVAEIEDGASPCQHTEYAKEYQIQLGNMTMHMFDTKGLSDPSVSAKKIFGTMRRELRRVDLLIICHKLYSKVDESMYKLGTNLKQYCGSDMFDHAIIVLTQADEYKVHCKSYREGRDEAAVRAEMIVRIESVMTELQAMLVDRHQVITKHHFSTIPVCVSSSYTKEPLPTTDDWEAELWHHMAKRCTEKAVPLLGFLARNRQKILIVSGTGAGGVAGVAAGAAIGGVAGTAIPIPVAGTVIGAVVGGAVIGTIVIATVAATKAVTK